MKRWRAEGTTWRLRVEQLPDPAPLTTGTRRRLTVARDRASLGATQLTVGSIRAHSTRAKPTLA